MKEISQYLFIAKLICKERITGLDDSERRQLDLWRNESKEGERVFLNLQKISTDGKISRNGNNREGEI